jgi:hypothetical protein
VRQAAGTGTSNWPLHQPLMIDEFGAVMRLYLITVKQCAHSEISPTVTLSTINPTWTIMKLNSNLCVEEPAIN